MKNIAYLTIILLLTACQNKQSNKDELTGTEPEIKTPLYVQMARSEMKRNPDPRLLDFREKPKWEYTNGLICLSFLEVYRATGDEQFLNYTKFYADSMITAEGDILTYKLSDYNIDRLNPGRYLINLQQISPKPKYQMAIDTLRKQVEQHPKTSEGGFWHKKRYPHQMWLDGLYMGSPFLTLYGKTYGDTALFDLVAKQFQLIDKYTYVEKKGLYKHGWDESREQKWADPETGLSPNYWGRAMGWLAMAVVDVLDHFPEDHPNRNNLLEITTKIADGAVQYQDSSGLWWQILDKPGEEGNYLEASVSSMFAYFLLKGVDRGYLDQSYLDYGKKAYEGIVSDLITIDENGLTNLNQVCAVAGLGGDPYRDGTYEYYVNETIRANDPKGVGPFIMAGILYEKLPIEK